MHGHLNTTFSSSEYCFLDNWGQNPEFLCIVYVSIHYQSLRLCPHNAYDGHIMHQWPIPAREVENLLTAPKNRTSSYSDTRLSTFWCAPNDVELTEKDAGQF